MRSFWTAVRFLTVFPVPKQDGSGLEYAQTAPLFFPVVGALLGFLLAGLDRAFSLLFPEPVLSALVLAFWVFVSGGLHLDGLADTADALLSCKTREQILDIMRDVHTGAMAVITVSCFLILKFSVLSSLNPLERWKVIVFMVVLGRCSLLWIMGFFPYARRETGGGLASFFSGCNKKHAVFYLIVAAILGFLFFGLSGIWATLFCFVPIFLFNLFLRQKIGGYTGDTLGACCEAAEVLPVLCLLALS